MSKKKIIWIIVLIIIIALIAVGIIFARPQDKTNATNTATFNKSENVTENTVEDATTQSKEYQKVQLDDGILYSLDGSKKEADIVIGTNYYDTTINDMYLNPNNYYNKTIEIEGLYFENMKYTFVGRYSTSNMCPNCPTGYSYLEYQLDGKLNHRFTDGNEWIKVVGTLAKGNDATSGYQDYYYLKVLTLEIMNEKGQTTVNN